jgi:hypothetical protein
MGIAEHAVQRLVTDLTRRLAVNTIYTLKRRVPYLRATG